MHDQPLQPRAAEADSTPADAIVEFQLTRQQIKYAESRYLLYRCGGRLTVASVAMIALSIGVSFDFSSGIPFAVKQLSVMLLATALYLSLVYQVRRKIDRQRSHYGVVEDTNIAVDVIDHCLRWEGSQGVFDFELPDVTLIKTPRGLVVASDPDLFLYLPRKAAYTSSSYRQFVGQLFERQLTALAERKR